MTAPDNGRAVPREVWRIAHEALEGRVESVDRELAARIEAIERRHEREDEQARMDVITRAAERRTQRRQILGGIFLACLPLIISALLAYLNAGH